MTPEQEKAARAYRKRQALDKWLADRVADMERNPRMYLTFGVLLVAVLLFMLWPQ